MKGNRIEFHSTHVSEEAKVTLLLLCVESSNEHSSMNNSWKKRRRERERVTGETWSTRWWYKERWMVCIYIKFFNLVLQESTLSMTKVFIPLYIIYHVHSRWSSKFLISNERKGERKGREKEEKERSQVISHFLGKDSYIRTSSLLSRTSSSQNFFLLIQKWPKWFMWE